MIQGEALKRIRGFVYRKKYDQRELIKVAQRQFRKYMQMRDWGWFVIIQKTRGLIGLPNPAEELALLEAKAGRNHFLLAFFSLQMMSLIGSVTNFFAQVQPGASMTNS